MFYQEQTTPNSNNVLYNQPSSLRCVVLFPGLTDGYELYGPGNRILMCSKHRFEHIRDVELVHAQCALRGLRGLRGLHALHAHMVISITYRMFQ